MADNVLNENEGEIRDLLGFTKTKQLVYKERDDGRSIKSTTVTGMKLVRLDSDGQMGTLDIQLEDGREIRICSAYLKEMQLARFSFETKLEETE